MVLLNVYPFLNTVNDFDKSFDLGLSNNININTYLFDLNDGRRQQLEKTK